tara:strand:+ start:2819 stop:2962 length:144 start_codon:yes stop_codon:yes gene_type:complete
MNGLEVLGYLLANEPTLWGLIGLGVVGVVLSIIWDKHQSATDDISWW